MTEKEKMLAGQMYDCGDHELMKIWNSKKNLMQEYNNLDYYDKTGQPEFKKQVQRKLIRCFEV